MAIFPGSAIPSAASDYEIENSLRFDDGDSAYLSRTPSAAGNRKTCTISMWIKRGSLGINGQLFTVAEGATTSYGRTEMVLDTSDNLTWKIRTDPSGTTLLELKTTQVFRDPSSWMHLVFTLDTTQATASDRAKIYVNGEQVTAFTTATYPSQNVDTLFNMTYLHAIGKYAVPDQSNYWDGYIAEF